MMQEQLFFFMVAVSTLISLCYLVWGILLLPSIQKRKQGQAEHSRSGYLIRFFIMLLCPVVGPVFFLVGHLITITLFWQDVDLEDVIFSKERVVTHLHADEERGRNMVSIEEAIAISDKENLRQLMMNVIKGDIQESLSAIALALNSEDSEASHYAASVLRDELNDFRLNVQKIFREIQKEDAKETEYEQMLIPYMNRVLEQNVFTAMEQKNFVELFAKTGEILYQKNRQAMTSQYYEWICLRLLEIEAFPAMEEWCLRAQKQYPKALSTYTCQLKLYFTTQNRERFFAVMETLKKSSIVIDQETLELIRIFN